jgi:predicted RNA-binding protein with PIN domain
LRAVPLFFAPFGYTSCLAASLGRARIGVPSALARGSRLNGFSMYYLIDGYNLLHAMGVLTGSVGPTGLERARLNLLGVLSGAMGSDARNVTVVFDASNPPRGVPSQFDYHGLHVVFAVEQDAADDLIEQFIQKASAPKNLTVVSDDRRIRQAAERRRCVVQNCEAFLETLQRKRRQHKPKTDGAPAKPLNVSGTETQHWLEEFADLADDPDLKELFDPHGFLEDEADH